MTEGIGKEHTGGAGEDGGGEPGEDSVESQGRTGVGEPLISQAYM